MSDKERDPDNVKKNAQKNTRLANIELLRVLSMLLVVTNHFFYHGGILDAAAPYTFDHYFAYCAFGVSNAAVASYVLISGYFLCESKFSFKKLLLLVIQICTYSFFLTVTLSLTGVVSLSPEQILRACLPVLSGQYWFATMYVGLYILFPFLNAGLKTLTKERHLVLAVVLFLLFGAWPSLLPFSDGLNGGGSRSVAWFVTLYIIAAYIRFYAPLQNLRARTLAALSATFLSLVLLSKFCVELLAFTPLVRFISRETLIDRASLYFWGNNSILMLPAALFCFLFFLRIRARAARLILFFAPLTFGVYLFHETGAMRTALWAFVDAPAQLGRPYFIPFAVGVILAVFAIGALFEWLRQRIMRPFTHSAFLTIGCVRAQTCAERFFGRVCAFLSKELHGNS